MKHRTQLGQAAAEYLGVVVVVAAIIGAVVQTSPGSAIAGGLKREVCRIATTGSCGAKPSTPAGPLGADGPQLPGAPTKGPALGNGYPIKNIGWDRSASLSVSNSPHELKLGKGSATGGLYLEGSVSASRSACRLDENGRPVRSLTVTGTFKRGYSAGGSAGKVSADVKKYEGNSLSYTITTDPKTADGINDGDVPSPGDPLKLKPGTVIALNEDWFKGTDGSLSYGPTTGGGSQDKGRRLSASVARVGGSTVRVTVGDAKFIRDNGTLGTDAPISLKLGSSSDSSTGLARSVDLDLSNPVAKRAYQQFLATGRLPQTNGTSIGRQRDAKVNTTARTDGYGIDVKSELGPIKVKLGLGFNTNEYNNKSVQTYEPDGSVTSTVYDQKNGVGVYSTRTINADGSLGPTRYSMRLQGVDKTTVNALQAGRGGSKLANGNRDVQLSFTDAQLNTLRDQAFEQIKYQYEQGGADLTDDQIRDLIKEGKAPTFLGPTTNGVELAIAQAKDPQAALAALIAKANGNPDVMALMLQQFAFNTLKARGKPDDLNGLRDNPDVFPFPTPSYTNPACD